VIDWFVEAVYARGFDLDVWRFLEGTRTAEAAALAIGCDVAQIVKSLVFLADDLPVLALTSGKNRVDPARLALVAGAAGVRRASAGITAAFVEVGSQGASMAVPRVQ